MADPLGWCAAELARLEREGLRRHPVTLSSPQGPEVVLGGRRVVQLCSNDYLGLAADPRLRRAAAAAARRWGAGTGASRLVSGTSDLHRALEASLAGLKGCEDAILFSSGYLANVGTIPALAGKEDAVFSDELNHASIIDGCRLAGAKVVVYRHADVGDLERALSSVDARRRLVVTDTVFSMQGDLAPVPDIARLCERHGAMLMVDDAHATGLLEGAGAGIVMSTLSKALGSAGGFVAGRRDVVEWLRNRARSYVFDTAPSPAAAGAAAEALRIVAAEPHRGPGVVAAAARLAQALAGLGYDVGRPAAAIVPVFVGGGPEAMALSSRLLDHGIFVPAIRPPSVPPGTARLRVTVTAAHTEEHLAAAVAAFASVRRGAGQRQPRRQPGATGAIDRRIVGAGGIFVTGTGSGVGKTVGAAAVARTLRRAGLGVAAMKPAQTGTSEGADDLAFIRLAGGVPAARCSATYSLRRPLAPSVAARMEGISLEPGRIIDDFRRLRRQADVVVIEGAGGLLVPFNDSADMADLASALQVPLLIVALPGLGTLNHIALTLDAARTRGLEVAGVVLCGFPAEPGLAEATNPGEVEELAGVVPHLPGLDVDRGIVPPAFEPAPWLAPRLGGTFDRAAFLRRVACARELV
ncbi:MAG: 8-amino-7-oxononanoate synthase [Actinomycetota bacterium]|nr:8-amino-7-oxononanoate synthase [Actinomycetota bacterium]